ncbi:MAG: PP2C family protein-serine/threonine phosphatase [Planctomycetota bacterium]|nr:PP2C family protein-serine/threonine phosphatase [Planctomycetota bacterium]
MHHARVVIAAETDAADRAAWWCSEIARGWPRRGEAPACEAVMLETFADRLRDETGPGVAADTVVVLVCPTPSRAGPTLMQTLDRLIGARTPTLVLSGDADRLRMELEPQGIVVERLNADSNRITSVLQTLLVRQAAVDLLGTELRVAGASQTGLSGEIGRLHDELQLAGAVQRRFLPRELPKLPGYEFGVFFRPCGFVSGDIYDVVAIDDSRIAFMVADAVGHGVPAALLTLVLGRALRQSPADGEAHPLASPARTLARLNEELCIENETGDRFATAVCGVVDTRTGAVTLSGAGHPASIRLGTDSAAEEIDGGEGPLLGVFPDAPFTERTFTLGPGETLVLYSDGFEVVFPDPASEAESVSANQAYITHFAEIAGRAGGAEEAVALLAADVDAQAGSLNQRDDLTALVLCRAAGSLCVAEPGEGSRVAA